MINVAAITHGNLSHFYVDFYVIFIAAVFVLKQYECTFSDSKGSIQYNINALPKITWLLQSTDSGALPQ